MRVAIATILGTCDRREGQGGDGPSRSGAPSSSPDLGRHTWLGQPAWVPPPTSERHSFDLDVLSVPRCGGRMSVIVTIEARDVIRAILGHPGLPAESPTPRPPRPSPQASMLPDLFGVTPA